MITQAISATDVVAVLEGDFGFAAAVAEFGLLLRDSEFKGSASYNHVLSASLAAKGDDRFGYRQEFIELVRKAKQVDDRAEGAGGIRFKSGEQTQESGQ